MGAMIAFLWERTPGYVKWPLTFSFFIFLVPLKIRDELSGFVQSEVHAIVIPIKEKRDIEMLQLRGDIHQIKQDTRDIRNHLMSKP